MTLDDRNLLLLGLYTDGARSAVLAKLNPYYGERFVVGQYLAVQPWQALRDALVDVRLCRADQVLVLSNAGLDPYRLWRRGTEPDDLERVKIEALHILIKDFHRWRYIEVHGNQLQATKELL